MGTLFILRQRCCPSQNTGPRVTFRREPISYIYPQMPIIELQPRSIKSMVEAFLCSANRLQIIMKQPERSWLASINRAGAFFFPVVIILP